MEEKIYDYSREALRGKRIIFDGDSICHATSESNDDPNRGWAYRVGNAFGMEWYNVGISGGTVTAEMYSSVTGNPRHWVSRNIDRIHEQFAEVDYLIFEGGTNDADLLGIGSEKFGVLDPGDFSGNYDDSTFTGACESLFFKALSYYPKAKLGFIIAPKMGRPKGGYGSDYKRRHYFERVIEVCKKWGVPYIDLWESCPLNPSLKCHYDPDLNGAQNRDTGRMYCDGQHLTKHGYDAVSPAIAAFVASL